MDSNTTYIDAEFQLTHAFADGRLEYYPPGEEFACAEEYPLMQTVSDDSGADGNTEATHAGNVKTLMKYIVAAGTAMGVSLGGFFGS